MQEKHLHWLIWLHETDYPCLEDPSKMCWVPAQGLSLVSPHPKTNEFGNVYPHLSRTSQAHASCKREVKKLLSGPLAFFQNSEQ